MGLAFRKPTLASHRRPLATGGSVDVNVTPSSAAQAPTISANSSVPAPTPVTDASNAAGTTSPPMATPTPIAQPSFSPQPFSNAIGTVPTSALSGGQAGYGAIAPVSNQGIPTGSPASPVTPSAFGTASPPASTAPVAFSPSSISPGATLTSLFPNGIPSNVAGQAPTNTYSMLDGQTQALVNSDLSSASPSASSSGTTAKRGGAIKKLASGGGAPNANEMMPYYARAEERGMMHPEGLVKSFGGGRTDIHPIDVPAGSYVVPADVTSGLAEGNTLAGSGVIDMMMHSNPYGIEGGKGRGGGDVGGPPKAHQGPLTVEAPPPASRGGSPKSPQGQSRVPIIVAGGEHIIYPQTIIKKFGDLKKGHAVLDKWVLNTRQKTIKDMKGLKGPKR